MSRRLIAVLAIAAVLCVVPARADWNPGDPHKMHYPQLPDPFGWDVNMTYPKVLADDWRCSQTGPVSDIHFWFSVERDAGQPAPNPDAVLNYVQSVLQNVHVSIHADIPAQPGTYSRPGALLWQRDFSPTNPALKLRWYGQGDQGWYDPNPPSIARRPDHNLYFQANLTNIPQPFLQQLGTIYWLDLSLMLAPNAPFKIGWKTSLDHFNDDAVWGDFLPTTDWHELRDPFNGQSLDLAFVITPEPATLSLLALGGLALLRRRGPR